MRNSKILAVIVTYHPDYIQLERLVSSIVTQVDQVLIIDNATPNFSAQVNLTNLTITELVINAQNMGLACAYNQACSLAREKDFSHLLLLDQDSLPAADMVKHLAHVLEAANQQKLTTAAAGPYYRDSKLSDISPFVKLSGLTLQRVACNADQQVEVDHLISSGALIDIRAIEKIGAFIAELFIDYVDTEWCWRARRSGLKLLGVGAATMDHNLGDSQFKEFGKARILHAPFRLYYQLRNQLWMIRQPWIGAQWRTMDILRCLKIFTAVALFAPDRWLRIRFMLRGIGDGIRGKMGKLPNEHKESAPNLQK